MSTIKLLAGLVTGVAVGATLGILFAPNDEKTVNKKLTKQVDDLTENIMTGFNDIMDRLISKMDTIKEGVHNSTSNGKAKAKDAFNEVSGTSKAKLR